MISKRDKKEDFVWLAIPGFILFGMGIGFYINNVPAGMFSGLGIGFIIAMVLGLKYAKK